jgi:hypothetical protein
MRSEVPPPGPRLEFDAWRRVLTAELRRYLPDVRASMNRRGESQRQFDRVRVLPARVAAQGAVPAP